MNILSTSKEKKTRKYSTITRTKQAKALDEIKTPGQTQRNLAERYEVPRTTLQHWINRKNKLKGKFDPNVVEFFESSSGQAWLHGMVISTFVVFHQNGNSGIPCLQNYFKMANIDKFVGSSQTALQNIAKKLDKQIKNFGKEESERLAQNMPHKSITGALDENFIMDEMTLILMEPVSNFILAEQIEEKRDAETWERVTKSALNGLNVTLHQLVGDEAGGVTKLATTSLNIIKGPDLFHIQQEITRGVTSHLGRTLQKEKKKQENLQKEKQDRFEKLGGYIKNVESINKLPNRGGNAGKRIIEIEKEEPANQKKIDEIENQYKTAQEARQNITDIYHPFNLDSGEIQAPELVREKIEKCYETLESISEKAEGQGQA